ncbi:MAG: ubiquinol-cytochrome c reductase iron-sulfur subunit [Candidatus Nanopelagicaceae bacterium]
MENQKEVSRRAVLCGLAVLTLGLVPDKAIAATGVKVLANGKVDVTLSRNKALRKVGGVVQFTDGAGQEIALVRTGKSAKAYRALNLSCTHEGTTVMRSGSKWVCPNHRAEFAINGNVKIGPARSNLAAIPVKVSKTKVTVG